MAVDTLTAPAAAAAASIACAGENCRRPLFMAVVRCPYCGMPQAKTADAAVSAKADDPPAAAEAIATAGAAAGTTGVAALGPGATGTKTVTVTEPGSVSPFWWVVAVVVVLVGGLLARDRWVNPPGTPRESQIIDTDWQPLHLPATATLVADGPFRLRSGPDLYAIPMDVGVSVPPPIGEQPLEVRAIAGKVRLEARY